MRVLFVTYCFGGGGGQALIGVYKRGLRVAMELCDRGHEVLFYCTGREGYEDDLTRAAERRMTFVDFDFEEKGLEEAELARARFRDRMAALRLDMVVIGEVPNAGAMLEATLCACELSLPVVLLDNAYDRMSVYRFCMEQGAMADAIVLTGTSSQHVRLPRPPEWLCQVPPYVESSPEEARQVLAGLGLTGERLVTVLAYDRKVELVARSLLASLDAPDERPAMEYLFLTRTPDESLDGIPEALRARVRLIAIPPDPVLFGLVQLSRLAIVKYGYMQVTECLALQTPVVAVFHEGNTWADILPAHVQRFVCVCSGPDGRTAGEAARLLRVPVEEMEEVHDGRLGAATATADFLERLPRSPRSGTWQDTTWLGFREDRVRDALVRELGRDSFEIDVLRAMYLRSVPGGELYLLLCGCRVDGEERFVRLWGRQFASPAAAERDLAAPGGLPRRVLFASPPDRLLIEADLGPALLPPL